MPQKTIWIINQYASTPETGMGGRHYYLARGLEKLGFRVYVIAACYTHLLRKAPSVSECFTVVRREGINMVWVKVPYYSQSHSKKRIWNWFYFSWKLPFLSSVLSDRPDVVLYSSPGLIGYLGAERLARKLKARLAFEVRDIWPLTLCEVGGYSPKHLFIRFLQWLEDRAYRNADVIISNLKYSYKHMVDHGLDITRFHWVSNGISLDEVENSEPLNEETAKALPQKGFCVGYAGTLGVVNSIWLLIDAAVLLKNNPEIKFVIVGNGKERLTLQNMAKEKGVSNVFFVDAVPKRQIQALLQRFDILSLPAKKSRLYEFGVSANKLFDYLYAAKPVIYAIESGEYHPVTDAGAGLEVPAENAEAIAEAILRLYHMSVAERTKMGENGRRTVLEQYEYDSLARKLATALLVL